MAAPPPGDPPVPASSPDLLEQELPTVLQDLVPLGYLVDRVVAQAYSDLATLIETLPSHSDQLRKRALVDYVLHTRRQLVKLLVLTRWSTEAKPIHKAMNLVGFLSRQNHAVDSAVSALDHAATQLAGARLRNYDLDSALSVLTSGTYPALPLALSQPFTMSGPLTDADVVATLHDVDAVLRWRLVMRLDHVPLAMRRVPWRVADGRVVFTVPGLWEAAFTYGGAADDPDEDEPDARAHEGAEWFLLRVKFLFRVRDARGTWNPSPTGPLKEHLVDMCNRELLRRPALPPPAAPAPEPAPAGADPALALASDGAAPPPADGPKPAHNGDGSAAHGAAGAQEGEGEGEDGDKARRAQEDERREAVRKRRRDRPLDRAYTFLQRLALSYQLEAVAASAARLAVTSWSGHLSVEVSAERDEVRVGYWTYRPEMPPQQQQQRPPPSTAAGAAQRPGPGGTLVFSVRAPAASAAPGPAGTSAAPPVSVAQAREDALQAAFAAASSTSSASALISAPVDAEPASSSAAAVPAALSVTWLPPSSLSPPSSLDPALSPPSPLALDCDLSLPADLDIEPLLRRVTARHARETVLRLGELFREAGEAGAQVVFDDGASADDEDDDQEGYDGEEQDERALRVPHVRIPLLPSSAADLSPSTSTTAAASMAAAPPRQALAAHIDPRTGRFELRTATSSVSSSAAGAGASATADEAGAEGGGARAQRLRAASERIDRERFAAAGLGGPAVAVSAAGQGERDEGWMRAVGDVVARIRASTILDDLDTLLSLLALPLAGPTTRRLPLPARELAKLGPNPALQSGRSALLFVPLVVPGSRGSSATLIGSSAAAGAGATAPRDQWFVAFVLFDEGLRAALVRAREASDGMNAFLEVGEVGWLGRAEGPASAGAGAGERGAEGGRAGEGEGARKGANLGYEVRGETVLGLWGQCVHRVALFDLERQLSARRIPYRLSTAPPSTSSPAPPPTSFLGKDPTTTPRPFLLVHSASLVRLPEAERFVARDAALQCAVDGQGRIRTTLHLCFRLPLPPGALPDPTELPPGVLWNPKRGVLVLAVEDALESSVERLLRAYALALRTVTAAAHAAAAAAAQPTSPSKKRSGPTTATPKAQLKGLPNGTGA